MRTKEKIKQKIENLKQDIVQDVMTGCFTDFELHECKCWIEALEYVLDEECENE